MRAPPDTLMAPRRRGGVATQRPAKPSTPVRFRSSPLGPRRVRCPTDVGGTARLEQRTSVDQSAARRHRSRVRVPGSGTHRRSARNDAWQHTRRRLRNDVRGQRRSTPTRKPPLPRPSSRPVRARSRSWSVRSGDSGAEYELRILRPAGGGELTAVGTSTAHCVPNSNNEVRGPFAVSLSVKAGDLIALHVIKGQGAPINNVAAPAADELNYLEDPFATGKPRNRRKNRSTAAARSCCSRRLQSGRPGQHRASANRRRTAGRLAAHGHRRELGRREHLHLPVAPLPRRILRTDRRRHRSIYTPTSADEGKQIAVVVTATGEGGKTNAQSAATDGVKPGAAPPPANTALPQVSGEARETETLTGTIGSWAGGPTSFAEQWVRCATASGTNCAPIAGASSLTYVPVHADVGSTLRLRVTATNGVGPTTVESAPTAIVQPLVIKAVLTASPAGTFCTGVPVQFDGTASKTPNPPIVNYRFTYIEFPIGAGLLFLAGPQALEEYVHSLPVHELASGHSPSTTTTFTWNKIATEEDTSRAGCRAAVARSGRRDIDGDRPRRRQLQGQRPAPPRAELRSRNANQMPQNHPHQVPALGHRRPHQRPAQRQRRREHDDVQERRAVRGVGLGPRRARAAGRAGVGREGQAQTDRARTLHLLQHPTASQGDDPCAPYADRKGAAQTRASRSRDRPAHERHAHGRQEHPLDPRHADPPVAARARR